jgi:uroporphyrinogen-III decarboxylase
VGLLARGTPDEVRRTTAALISAVAACGHKRFVVSSGCTLAIDTPAANIEAMLDGVYRRDDCAERPSGRA